MLTDLERKVLRILGNYQLKHSMSPTISMLKTFTGRRDDASIYKALQRLNDERYIQWDRRDPNRILVFESFERKRSYF